MGTMTGTNLEAFAEATGIRPAGSDTDAELERVQGMALDLIRCIERERAGIRDGDGYWHGSNPALGLAQEILAAIERAR